MHSQFHELVAAAGLERVASELLGAALPAIGFSARAVHSPCRLDSSRIGGRPALPTAFEWPTNSKRPLDFLLQINLADVASLNAQRLLPSSGILSFFYDLDEQPWGFDPADLDGYIVHYFPAVNSLLEHEIPNPDFAMPECELTFYCLDTLPHCGSRAEMKLMGSTGLTNAQLDSYDDLASQIERLSIPTKHMGNHHLLGHSDNLQGDMQLEAQLDSMGLDWGDLAGYKVPQRKALELAADEWLLLLQLDSDYENNFMWGDGGMLYYWIQRDDLVNLRFDRVWMTLQCG